MTNQQSQIVFLFFCSLTVSFPQTKTLKIHFLYLRLQVVDLIIQLCLSSRHGAPFTPPHPTPHPHIPLSTIITLILCLGFLATPLSTVFTYFCLFSPIVSHVFCHSSPLLCCFSVWLHWSRDMSTSHCKCVDTFCNTQDNAPMQHNCCCRRKMGPHLTETIFTVHTLVCD